MPKEKPLEIRFDLWIKAPVKTVWKALTDPKLIPRWSYMQKVTLDRLQPGGVFRFHCDNDQGPPDRGEILAVTPGKKLVYLWYSSEPEPTRVEYVLTPKGRYTKLTFRNRGFAEGGKWSDFYERDAMGWFEMHVAMKRKVEGRAPASKP